MKIAVHQMCSGVDPSRNASAMAAAIADAAANMAAFYFAPEMSLLLDRDRTRAKQNIMLEADNPAIRIICKAAADAGIWVHIGSLPVVFEQDQTRFANRTLVIDSKGIIRARYDKMHLFDVSLDSGENWRESAAYAPGNHATVVDTPFGLMGLTICYDMRFTDLYSALAKAGSQFLAIPAAFTVPTGTAHWHTLLRARAIESQAFVIAAAQSGDHEDGRKTYGHSLVVDPWGEVLLDMGEGEGLGFVKLNLARIAEVRGQIPVHANRRDIAGKVKRY